MPASRPDRRTWFVGPWELSAATALLPPSPGAGRVLLVESRSKGAALPWHRHKLVLVLSALRHFAADLRDRGFEVDHRVAESYAGGIVAHAREFNPVEIVAQQPAEWGIGQSLLSLGSHEASSGTENPQRASDPVSFALRDAPTTQLTIMPDRRFLVSRTEFASWAQGRKLFRMEDFYRWQRKRLHILMTAEDGPVGGQWNYDPENRQGARAMKKRGAPPAPRQIEPDAITSRVMGLVDRLPDHWGSVAGFGLPVTRAAALETLDEFIAERLEWFGPFQDAIVSEQPYGYHARIAAAMNIGLLHPREIVERAVASSAPLASVEGFVRQILGWREYVNGIYWREMPSYRHRNYFGFSKPLPQLFWDPDRTDLACLASAVRGVRDSAYAHHIQRLMILANFATLAGVDPLRLSEWFWAGFADAMEWVELPNVIGMGTYADGGLLSSKPYVSSGAYIDRMSDHCAGCRYDRTRRTGTNACPFNYLYWTFLDDIRTGRLDVGMRMQLVLKGLDRIPAAELALMTALRAAFLERLTPDSTGWTFRHDQG